MFQHFFSMSSFYKFVSENIMETFRVHMYIFLIFPGSIDPVSKDDRYVCVFFLIFIYIKALVFI